MKRTDFIIITILLVLVVANILLPVSRADANATNPTTYALTTRVTGLDRDKDLVICEDSNGHLWTFYGCEDWEIGDCASLLMNDNDTPSIEDDTVESVRYSAWTLTH